MTIQKYEDWMRPQVVALFNLEYGTESGTFDTLFRNFYEHSFQQGKCIRIVAVEDKKIAGFQSFFYWPVIHQGKKLRSYQSGNSLVHPDFRGKGLFARMLNFIDDPANGFDCELLIGFPVEASYNSFMRNNWENPFDLQWYVKTLSPIRSFIFAPEKKLAGPRFTRIEEDFPADPQITHVAQSAAMDAYRFKYENGEFYRYHFELNGMKGWFELKVQRRKKIISELIIGKFLSSHDDEAFIESAFRDLIRAVKRSASFTIISCAVNPDSTLARVLTRIHFRKIDRKIYFIAKGAVTKQIKSWNNWWMFRADIDTW